LGFFAFAIDSQYLLLFAELFVFPITDFLKDSAKHLLEPGAFIILRRTVHRFISSQDINRISRVSRATPVSACQNS